MEDALSQLRARQMAAPAFARLASQLGAIPTSDRSLRALSRAYQRLTIEVKKTRRLRVDVCATYAQWRKAGRSLAFVSTVYERALARVGVRRVIAHRAFITAANQAPALRRLGLDGNGALTVISPANFFGL